MTLNRFITAITVFVWCAAISARAQEQNWERTTVYRDSISASMATIYTDGIAREIQTRLYLNESEGLINITEFDAAGREKFTWKAAAIHFASSPAYISPDSFKTKARAYHSDQQPYSQKNWWDDPLGRIFGIGGPGAMFLPSDAPNAGANSHATHSWYLGRADTTFLSAQQLSNPGNAANQPDAAYYLTVTRDPNGGMIQSISDIFGHIIKSRTYSDSNFTDAIESSTKFDALGNVTRETPPQDGNAIQPTLYRYDSLGLLIQKQTPDAGIVKYRYDRANRCIGTQDQKQRETGSGETYTATVYDVFGRPIAAGLASRFSALSPDRPPTIADITMIKLKSFYDGTESIAELDVPPDILSTLYNLRGRLVASVAYDYTGNVSKKHRVAEVYSYDDEGRIAVKYKLIPSLGIQKFTYTYNLQGNLVVANYCDDYVKKSNTRTTAHYYQYDALGRLVAIRNGASPGSAMIAAFEYDKSGRLIRKTQYANDGVTQVAQTQNEYNLRDWTTLISNSTSPGGPSYAESIDYFTNTASPQYNGNIAKATMTYASVPGLPANPYYTYNYSYDRANRLTIVDNVEVPLQDEAFSYYKDGRFRRKASGTTSTAGATDYQYESGKSRLVNQPIKNLASNYLYDPNGNMVVDKSKLMTITYDYNNLPAIFRFYSQIPSTIDGQPLAWSNVDKIDKSALVSSVAVMYDASGNRVLKTALEKD